MEREPLTVTVDDCSATTGLGRTSIYKALKAGELEKVVASGRTLITYASIKALIDRGRAPRASQMIAGKLFQDNDL